jgi:hypothetical protein
MPLLAHAQGAFVCMKKTIVPHFVVDLTSSALVTICFVMTVIWSFRGYGRKNGAADNGFPSLSNAFYPLLVDK